MHLIKLLLLVCIAILAFGCGGGASDMIVTPNLPPMMPAAVPAEADNEDKAEDEDEDEPDPHEIAEHLIEFLALLSELLSIYEPSELIALLRWEIKETQISEFEVEHARGGRLPFPITDIMFGSASSASSGPRGLLGKPGQYHSAKYRSARQPGRCSTQPNHFLRAVA